MMMAAFGELSHLHPSPAFNVTVDGIATFVYMATVEGPANGSFVHVPLVCTVGSECLHRAVEITPLGLVERTVETAEIRPAGPEVLRTNATSWRFDVSAPFRGILEFGGRYEGPSIASGLMIFAEAVDASPPSRTDPSVIYFGPGVHRLPLQPR
jgi:hypothetical protein